MEQRAEISPTKAKEILFVRPARRDRERVSNLQGKERNKHIFVAFSIAAIAGRRPKPVI